MTCNPLLLWLPPLTVRAMQYVLHFPKGHKYVSILKTADTPEAQAQLEQQRAALRTLARQQAADAAALGERDEGRSLGMLQALSHALLNL